MPPGAPRRAGRRARGLPHVRGNEPVGGPTSGVRGRSGGGGGAATAAFVRTVTPVYPMTWGVEHNGGFAGGCAQPGVPSALHGGSSGPKTNGGHDARLPDFPEMHEPVSCADWNCNKSLSQEAYLLWWYGRLPRYGGNLKVGHTTTSGRTCSRSTAIPSYRSRRPSMETDHVRTMRGSAVGGGAPRCA